MQSYWERESLRRFDLIVVGGEIVGHSTALFYAESHPNARIAIFNRPLPRRGFNKNAGFAFGSIAELEHDLASLGRNNRGLVLSDSQVCSCCGKPSAIKPSTTAKWAGTNCFEASDSERINFFNNLLEPALGARPYSVVQNTGLGF